MKVNFFVEDIFNIANQGPVLAGVVKSGQLAIGMTTDLFGNRLMVKMIEKKNIKIELAATGDAVGVYLEGASYDLLKNHIKQEIIFTNK